MTLITYGYMKKIIYGLIIICSVLIVLTYFFPFGKSINKTTKISTKLNITSLSDIYNYVDDELLQKNGKYASLLQK